jgi:hypothetical protein
MSGPNERDGRGSSPVDGPSVLANLPRTRPQRATARRAAARGSNAAGPATSNETTEAAERATVRDRAQTRKRAKPAPRAKGATPTRAKGATPAPRGKGATAGPSRPKSARTPAGKRGRAPAARRPSGSRPGRQSVPTQGFESEADRARGPVQPPGATELVASAVEIVGELAKSGLATGERLLKDVFSRLPPS